MAKPERKTVYRNSVDGQFITKKAADRNPRESEKERVVVAKPRKKKR